MQQPNFAQIWSKYLGGKNPKALNYSVRYDSNFFHDIVFLSSLIHDARIQKNNVKLTSKTLTLPLERDCWELGINKKKELHIAKTKLTISGVKELKWISRKPNTEELCLDYLWISEDFRKHDTDYFDFIFVGFNWRFKVKLDILKWSISLKDQEKPYLWSEKNKKL